MKKSESLLRWLSVSGFEHKTHVLVNGKAKQRTEISNVQKSYIKNSFAKQKLKSFADQILSYRVNVICRLHDGSSGRGIYF